MPRSAAPWLLAAVLAGCVGPALPASQLTGWHAAIVGRTLLLGDVERDSLRELASSLGRFDAAFAHLVGRVDAKDGATRLVFVIRDRELAARFGLGGYVAGWSTSSLGGQFAMVRAAPDLASTRRTLFHEYTHMLLFDGSRALLPAWYHEGLATYFSSLYFSDGVVAVGAPYAGRAARALRDPGMDLDAMLGGVVWSGDIDATADFYATAWALVHYLLATPDRRSELTAYIDLAARGTPVSEAREAAFARDLEPLTREFRAHTRLLARGAPAEVLLDAGALEIERPSLRALGRAEVAQALGSATLAVARSWPEGDGQRTRALARKLLERAVEFDASSPRTLAALGEARALAGDPGGAATAVRGALDRAPGDPMVLLHAGNVELAAAEGGESPAALRAAETRFRAALERVPASAPAWFGLGRTLVLAGRPAQAAEAYETARRNGWSAPLDLELGRLYLTQLDRADRAAALMLPLARDPHETTIRSQARALLEEAGLLDPQDPG